MSHSQVASCVVGESPAPYRGMKPDSGSAATSMIALPSPRLSTLKKAGFLLVHSFSTAIFSKGLD